MVSENVKYPVLPLMLDHALYMDEGRQGFRLVYGDIQII